MNDYRYYLTVTNNSDVYTLEEIYMPSATFTDKLTLTAGEPFSLDTPEGLMGLHAHFNDLGWELGSPIINTNDHYSCEVTF